MANFHECQEFFVSTQSQAPSDIQEVTENVQTFVKFHKESGKRIVLITSGGTSVPLEKRTVRYLDNFSTGTRGSLSAEEFLSHGYAVIFLYRQSSFHPFTRVLQSNANSVFDSLSCNSDGTLSVEESTKPPLLDAIRKCKEIKSKNLLLSVPFSDVFQYLYYLSHICKSLRTAGKMAMLYLAAAVSDFYIHPRDMVEHKIQSTSSLVLKLEQVPKMLYILVQEWVPEAFVVTFKLETNEDKLIRQSRLALEKYKHQIVVGNILEKRKEEVAVVSSDKIDVIKITPEERELGIIIENRLVLFLKAEHSKHV